MHKHRGNEGQVDRDICTLQARHFKSLSRIGISQNFSICNYVLPGYDLCRHCGISISKMNVITPVLKKDEDNYIKSNQNIINNRSQSSVSIIVANRYKHSLNF